MFIVRNKFHFGAYQSVINEASNLSKLSPADQVERDVLLYRSYIALGQYELVIAEINNSSPMALQAVKLLAEYFAGKKDQEATLATLQSWLADAACNSNPHVLLVAGTIFAQEGNFVDALKICHVGTTLEMSALCVQLYLKMDRPDKAEQVVKTMSAADDDAVVTQLATAWLNLSLGGAKVQEASYIYQELADKYNWTAMLYNARAVCHMKMGNFEEAERDLLEALNLNTKDPDTLANLVTCGLHLGKNVSRYNSQLGLSSPNHPIARKSLAADELFDRAAAAFA